MDELDRMYRRLVQNIRALFPELLTRPFEVSRIYQQIMPYRLNRRELGLETAEEYELALTQLVAGTRGLLVGDEEMQRALRKELEAASPDLSAFRGYATAMVSLSPDALRALEAQPAPSAGMVSGAMPAQPRSAASQAMLAARATEEVSVAARRAAETSAPPATSSTVIRSPAPSQPSAAVATPATDGCRYCGGSLPEGRKVVFCPHCGQNLTVRHCPACNSELELGWSFCVTCGREVS